MSKSAPQKDITERLFKVRLKNGRELGPMSIDRIRAFIAKDIITGLEVARLYPIGEWKDINSFHEISEVFLEKMEGKLEANRVEPSVTIPLVEGDESKNSNPKVSQSDQSEKTIIVTANDEKTTIVKVEENKLSQELVEISNKPQDLPESVEVNPFISEENTAFIERRLPLSESNNSEDIEKTSKRKRLIFGAIIACLGVIILFYQEPETSKTVLAPFQVKMPSSTKSEPQLAEKLLADALKIYYQDTADGYRRASTLLLEAASHDLNNVKVLCFLANAYLNLIEIVRRDENYFTIVTRIIELERAKGIDLPETVYADVELYLALGNPDAALQRIVEFAKTHTYGPEMYYYLALTLYHREQHEDAFNALGKIEAKDWFSPKVPFLYGLIFEKNNKPQEAKKAFEKTIERSPGHLRARLHLAEILLSSDQNADAETQLRFVLEKKEDLSVKEQARAQYLYSKIMLVQNKLPEALGAIEKAKRLLPEDPDIILEYFTLKARTGAEIQGAQSKAKMFNFLSLGEKALQEKKFDVAMKHFLNAREVSDKDQLPLVRIAETFRLQGNLPFAKINLGKAVELNKQNAELYPKYIKILIDVFEIEEAIRQIEIFKSLSPPTSLLDYLQGELYSRQEKFREAQLYYKRAINGTQPNAEIYIGFARMLFKGTQYKDAAFFYGLALRFDPLSVDANVGAAKALAEVDSLDQGVQHLLSAITRDKKHTVELYNGLAELYIQKGDASNAFKYVDKTLELNPEFAQAYKTRGDIFVSQEKVKEALDAYLTFSNLNPLDPSGRIERYKLFLKKLDLVSAKNEIETVIKILPRYPGAYYMLGELYREGQNYNSALEAAKKEIQINPRFLPAYVLAGSALNQSQEYGKALEMLNKALKYNPDYVPALIQAGFTNHMMKAYPAAQALLDRALSLDSGNPQIHKRLGYLHRDLSNVAKAKQHFRAYLDLLPDAQDKAEVQAYIAK